MLQFIVNTLLLMNHCTTHRLKPIHHKGIKLCHDLRQYHFRQGFQYYKNSIFDRFQQKYIQLSAFTSIIKISGFDWSLYCQIILRIVQILC